MDLNSLLVPFEMDTISWRAQTVTKDGKKALALAYIDARDVMRRLDDVCGLAGWQCKYSHANGKTICDIGIKCADEWIWKADGAGDTDVEAEKGAISDAFKRAAVKWGVGRYLYDLDAVWCPCESREHNGKNQFVRFTDDPWNHLKGKNPKSEVFQNASLRNQFFEKVVSAYNECETVDELRSVAAMDKDKTDRMLNGGNDADVMTVEELRKRYDLRAKQIKQKLQDEQMQQDFKQRG